jgi:ATP-binding protein involved in chromosome partitioning
MARPDEVAVRAALAAAKRDDGSPLLAPEAVGQVVTDEGWVAVVLADENAPRELLAQVFRHLTQAFAGAAVEVRAGMQVYRGGTGVGEGRHVVAVLGGKGGVGKSTLSVNLALTLTAMGHKVGLADGDLTGPDVPHLFGISTKEPPRRRGWDLMTARVRPPSKREQPQERFGVELMSAGFAVAERMPLFVSGFVPMVMRFLVFEVAWSADILLIDAPPGTGDELFAIAGRLPLSGAVFVTTPQDLAQMDAERTLALLEQHNVPVIGLVLNMASLTCPHCHEEIDLFAESTRLADAGLRVLGRIPFDTQLSAAADRGRPLVLGDPTGPIALEFARIGGAVQRWLAGR